MNSFAIIGINGTLGQPFLDVLTLSLFADKIQYPIKVISRTRQDNTEKVHYYHTDLSDTATAAQQLEGTDVIIELVASDPTLFAHVEKIVAEVKPRLFIPSQFGMDIATADKLIPGFSKIKTDHSARRRALGI